ncbi:FACT complex subunit Spt16p [Trichomonascus vanleenenianus]|uniref:chromatin-remodeling protein SPT16 n=1 Tax=Trichomonascus vanleenenianus TaxID=2268995 RepID=UPI003ECB2A7F
MSEVNVDRANFERRVGVLQSGLKAQEKGYNGAKAILVITGKTNEENIYAKSIVVHSWLLGYEFPSTALLITPEKVVFVTSAAKAKYLDGIAKSSGVTVLSRTKDAEHNKKLFEQLIGEVTAGGKTLGHLPKDVQEGAFVTEWEAAFGPAKKELELVDVSAGLSAAMEHKDEEELRTIRTAAKATDRLMNTYFVDQMSGYIDSERAVTHEKFAEQIENKIDDEKYFNNMKLGREFDPGQLDWCYSPIIQSGGKYDLRPSAFADKNRLQPGVILCSLGLRYKSYCSNVSRTFLIDPTKAQEENYNFLLALQAKALDAIKAGVACKDVYAAAVDYVKDKKPELVGNMLKNVGWGMGIEFRDSNAILSAKNESILKDGMTLNLVIGLQDLKDENKAGKTYSLLVADTIRVTTESAIVFSDSKKGASNVSFYFKDDKEAASKPAKSSNGRSTEPVAAKTRGGQNKSAILNTRLRGETKASDEVDTEKRRQLHQKELHEKLQKAVMEKYSGEDANQDNESKVVWKRFEAYKRDTQIPTGGGVKDLRIAVDARAQTILIPINGRPVPFHISTYKNGSKTDEGDYVYLRLNFYSPGQAGAVAKKDEIPFEDPGAQFIRSISLRSRDGERMAEVFKKITELKKEAVKREAQRKEFEDVVEQDKLVEMRQRRPLRLDSVFVRPGPEGKRVAGSLEIHQNGVRYHTGVGPGQRVDILFNNVKHFFFQPSDKELIVLMHFHLRSPIIIGKRKTYDVQFYREATDMAFDETGNKRRRYRYGDEDEYEAEQEERQRRRALNREFKGFAEKIAEASNRFDVDVPFRELGFDGVPHRSNVLCMPTTDCLVQLIDPPFMVVTLSEIELVHLERVSFGLRQFDMVIIFKDYRQPVRHINSIPMDQLDAVKDWLNEMDIPYHEGPLNLNWGPIMKSILSDPQGFCAKGGWSFLSMEDDGASDEEPPSEESEFNPSDENPSDESEAYSEEEEEEDDYSGSEEDEEDDDDLDEED